MGGYAVTAGTARVRDRPEVQAIVRELERLTADMDEGLLTVRPYRRAVQAARDGAAARSTQAAYEAQAIAVPGGDS